MVRPYRLLVVWKLFTDHIYPSALARMVSGLCPVAADLLLSFTVRWPESRSIAQGSTASNTILLKLNGACGFILLVQLRLGLQMCVPSCKDASHSPFVAWYDMYEGVWLTCFRVSNCL